jgi:hypothetical protein
MIIKINKDYYLAEILEDLGKSIKIIKKNKLPLNYYSHYKILDIPILSYNFLMGKEIILIK